MKRWSVVASVSCFQSNFVPSESSICILRYFCFFERKVNKQYLDFVNPSHRNLREQYIGLISGEVRLPPPFIRNL